MSPVKNRYSRSAVAQVSEPAVSRTSSLPAIRPATCDLSALERGRPRPQHRPPNPATRRSSALMRRHWHLELLWLLGFGAWSFSSLPLYKTGLFGTGTGLQTPPFLTNPQTISGPVPFWTARVQSTNPLTSRHSIAGGSLSPLPRGEGQGEGQTSMFSLSFRGAWSFALQTLHSALRT